MRHIDGVHTQLFNRSRQECRWDEGVFIWQSKAGGRGNVTDMPHPGAMVWGNSGAKPPDFVQYEADLMREKRTLLSNTISPSVKIIDNRNL